LPFLAAFLDEPFDPSPYAPASRLFWNELYVDPTRTPEWEHSPKARRLFESQRLTRDLKALRSSSTVDYRRLHARKREILEVLSELLHRRPSERRSDFQKFVDAHPLLQDYARFRATTERRRAPWPKWPSRLKDEALREGDYRQQDFRYHLYAQWLAHQQVDSLSKKARRAGAGLYLDLPLGVHPYGFDVWREQEAFVRNVDVGAPPDPIFTSGQDWGFHPFHPERSREQGHRYWIGSIRHQLGSAGLLRIDHVMGLHRLFWIPRGLDFKDGVYVRYPAHELYAVLCLESHRNRSIIVGENLGIVPKYVNRTMSRHNIQQMYLMQYSLRPDPERPMKPIPSGSVASLNTHDTPLFAAFWQDKDIEDRIDLGLLDEEGARREGIAREARKQALLTYLRKKGLLRKRIVLGSVLGACLSRLRRSRAGIVLVNLEDLWLETEPQNVPGSGGRRANWTRKLQFSLEELSQRDGVNDTLNLVNSSFSQGRDRRER
jgi:4-alpha-glucanotransferase